MMNGSRCGDRQAILLVGLAIRGSLTINGCGRANTADRVSVN